jgi:AraC family transcriptional regulator
MKSESAGDPAGEEGAQAAPLSVLRMERMTARLLGAVPEPPAELHLDEVRVFAPLTFARVSIGASSEPQLLRDPDLCIVPPGQRLHVRIDPGSEGILVAIDTLLCEERSVRVQGRPARVDGVRAGADDALRELVQGLAGDMRAGRPADGADDIALHLASTYGVVPPETSCAGLTRSRLERVLTLIDERLTEPLPVSELAEAVHLSPFHFSRMFRVSTGRSPHEWIMLKRMARAKALLATTRLPLPEVARASGYRTHSHFSGMFHAVVGMTPGQYRARHS